MENEGGLARQQDQAGGQARKEMGPEQLRQVQEVLEAIQYARDSIEGAQTIYLTEM